MINSNIKRNVVSNTGAVNFNKLSKWTAKIALYDPVPYKVLPSNRINFNNRSTNTNWVTLVFYIREDPTDAKEEEDAGLNCAQIILPLIFYICIAG